MKATIDGVVRAPSAFSMTFGLFPSMIAFSIAFAARGGAVGR